MYIFNQEICETSPKISVESRAFLYGEQVFTSFLIYDGKIINELRHLERLQKAVVSLFGQTINSFKLESHFTLIKDQVKKGAYRVRTDIFKVDQDLAILSSINSYHSFFFEDGEAEQIKVLTKKFHHERPGEFENLKLPFYSLEFLIRARDKCDFIKYSANEVISELSTSNLLIFDNKEFIIPKSNYLKGVTLQLFEDYTFEKYSKKLVLKEIKRQDLYSFDAVYALNAVDIIKVVSSIDGKEIKINNTIVNEFKNWLTQIRK